MPRGWEPRSSDTGFSVAVASIRGTVTVSVMYYIFRLPSTIHLPEKGNSFVWFLFGETAFLMNKGIGFLHVITWELELVARSSLELLIPLP